MNEEQYIMRAARDDDLEGCQVFRDLYSAWLTCDSRALLDLEVGPLAQHASRLIVATTDGTGHFLYTHYGEAVARHAGVSLEGQSTQALSYSGAALFRSSFLTTIEAEKPQITISRAQMSYSVHCWKRLLVPTTRSGSSLNTIIAAPAPVTFVKNVLDSVARDTGSLCGTVEPIIKNNQVSDFALFPVSNAGAVLPASSLSSLNKLLENKLSKSDLLSVIEASVGQVAIDTEIPRSFERFGRQYSIRISGGETQPVFSISDATHLFEARRDAERARKVMSDFAKTASDWLWETDENHCMTWVSGAINRATGFPNSHYIGKNRAEFSNLPENADILATHKRDLDARRPFRDLIYKTAAADGTDRWLRINGTPRYDDRGTFLGYRGSGSNITAEIEAKLALEEQSAAFEAFANIASDWMWFADEHHIMRWMSDAVERATGSPPSAFIGRSRIDLVRRHAEQEVFDRHIADLEARRPFRDFVYKIQGGDGSSCWIRVNGAPWFDDDGTFRGYRGTGTNITEEVEAREAAAQRAADLSEAHRLGRIGAWRYERATRSVTLSPEFLELVQLPPSSATLPLHKILPKLSSPTHQLIQRTYRTVLRSGAEQMIDVEWDIGAGRSIDLSVRAKPERDDDGRIVGVFGTVQDISERKASERQLENLAYFDPLTGLGNRAYFSRELGERFRLSAGDNRNRDDTSRGQAGLMLLDLDHFKEVNDTLGHAAGDELLRRVADRLKRCVGPEAIVCRLGGDEFAIIIPEVQSRAALGSLAANINSAFSGTVRLNEGAVHIATSIGLVMFPQQTSDPDEAMRFADLALYRAKEEGRSRSLFFQTEYDDEVQDRVSLARDLHQAVQDANLHAHYQLQVDLTSSCVSGFEALARWTHPTRGPISPSRFIPIAESSHLIADIGDWMLNEVCRQGRAWLDAGGAPLELSVNLSVAQLWHRDLEKDIRTALAKHDFPAELLCIELTESIFEDDTLARIEHLVKRLKGLGVRLALDDFGTGYSSMQYLNRLSFDKLKIDRSFVQGCDTSADQRRLLQGMVGLGKGLGMHVIVEGVENDDELRVVRDLGCDAVQGFYLARPLPFHDAALAAAQVEADYRLKPVIWRVERDNIDGDLSVIPSARAS